MSTSRILWPFRAKPAASEIVAQAIAQSVPDLDPVEHRMATAAVTRALQRVFGS